MSCNGGYFATKERLVISRSLAGEQIRLVQLSDAISFSENPLAARNLILTAASKGLSHLYWAIPSGLSAFAGPDGFRYDLNAGSFGLSWMSIDAYGSVVARERAAGLIRWIPQPRVRFVRLDATVAAELLAGQRARAARFSDGLYMIDGTVKAKKWLAATTFSTPIRVAPLHTLEAAMLAPGMPGTETSDNVDILLPDVYIKESFANVLHERPELCQDVRVRLQRTKRQKNDHAIDTQSTIKSQEPLPKPQVDDDPYKLKNRAPAVYAIYRTAELCSQNPDYVLGRSAKSKRREIANETLRDLTEVSPGLRDVFQTTRRGYATNLIDPERDPNAGMPPDQRREWPTAAAQELWSKLDERRQPFVNVTLMLTIHAAERWIEWKDLRPEGYGSRLSALDDWLAKHGLSGSQERATLFPIITFDGMQFQQLPKSGKP